MTRERNALKAGSFIVLSLLMILTVIFGIKGTRSLFDPTRLRTVEFALADDVGGLRIGDDVRVGGFKVGVVRSIAIDTAQPDKLPRILVTFSLPTRFVLRADYNIRIQSSVTGTSVLNFESLGTGAAVADDAILLGKPSTFSETFADLRATMTDLKVRALPAVTATIEKFGKTADAVTGAAQQAGVLVADVRGQIKPIVEKYNAVADSTKAAADRAGEMLVHVRDVFGEGKSDLKGTFANLNAASGSLKERLPGALEKFSGVLTRLDSALTNADSALRDIRTASADIKEVAAEARGILVTNRGKVDGMLTSLKATGDNLKNASAEIRRSPWRLLYKPDDVQAGHMNLFDAARQFAEGAAHLDSAATALRDAARSEKADPAKVEQLMRQLQERFKQFGDAEKKFWSSVRE